MTGLGTVPKVDHEELKSTIKTAGKAEKSVFVHGTFGVGKSEIVKETANDLAEQRGREFVDFNGTTDKKKRDILDNPEDYHVFVDIRLAEMKPENIKGIPNLQSDFEATEWEPPVWAKMLCLDGVSGTAFLDEANLASQSVQSAAYKIILDRQVGTHKLSDKINVVAAGNRAGKDNANVYTMAAPLKNRFLHVELEIPSAGQDGNWTKWAMENDLHEYIIGFVGSQAGAEFIHKFDDSNEEDHTIPTPRMWEFASDMLKAETGELTADKVRELVAPAVGNGVADELADFVRYRDDFSFNELLDNPSKAVELKAEDVGVKRSVMTGLAAEFNNDSEHFESIVEIATHVEPEFGALMLSQAKDYDEKGFKKGFYNLDNDQLETEAVEKYHAILGGISS